MPLDGIVADCIVEELRDKLIGGRIDKIFQPEPDLIVLNIRSKGRNFKLLICANPGFPRIHLTDEQRSNPPGAPLFSMILRKHLSGGRIGRIDFTGYERIITLDVENINELGDPSSKRLVTEIMGRHSNIILVGENDKIIDSIRHIGPDMSRVRQILPGRIYELPPGQDKILPQAVDPDTFFEDFALEDNPQKYLLDRIKGFSPYFSNRIVQTAAMGSPPYSREDVVKLKSVLYGALLKIKNREYTPYVFFEDSKPSDFHCVHLGEKPVDLSSSISKSMELFYSDKAFSDKLNGYRANISKIVETPMNRIIKKLSLLETALRDGANRDQLKLFGDLLTAYIYQVPANSKNVLLQNYNEEDLPLVNIPLNPNKSPQENAQIYYKKYAKAKSRYNHAIIQINEARRELAYLESILHNLESCTSIDDMDEIREELVLSGYLKKSAGKRGKTKAGSLAHDNLIQYISTSGHRIFVGKNNRQNDYLTFKFASRTDIWLHTRNIPGSHVIIKGGKGEIPDHAIEEAAMIAALHSKAGNSSNVPVDYTTVKFVKKPPKAKPGMVIYDNFKTLSVTPQRDRADKLKPPPR